jgi:eukaryotic-like serine/threonine-protein kinase
VALGSAELTAMYDEGGVFAGYTIERHPNIVTVYDRGVENDQLWISMRFIDGADASSLPAPVDPARAVRIVADEAQVPDWWHAAPLVQARLHPGCARLPTLRARQAVSV